MASHAVDGFQHSAAHGVGIVHLLNWDIVSQSTSVAGLCVKLRLYGAGEGNIASKAQFHCVLLKDGVPFTDRGTKYDYHGNTTYYMAWKNRSGKDQEIIRKYVVIEGGNTCYINTYDYETVPLAVSSVTTCDKGGVEIMFHGEVPKEDAKWTLLVLMSAGDKDLGWITAYVSKYALLNVKV